MEQLKELIPTPSKLNGVTNNEGVDQNSDPVHRKTEDCDPTSDCLTSEMKDLPVQTDQALPPLTERKNVLQLRLQQRRTREQLADQGIMPPLKSPAVYHDQRRSLERAKTEDYLKHKIRSRPEKTDLVNMHILQDTPAEGKLQATQMKLKRARLADDLNEKIAQRPGPLELVKKNIIPVDSAVKEAINVGQVNFPKAPDTFSFEEDSSNDALSPEQPRSQESQGSESLLPETKFTESSSPLATTTIQYLPHLSQQCDLNRCTPNNQIRQPGSQNQLNGQVSTPIPCTLR